MSESAKIPAMVTPKGPAAHTYLAKPDKKYLKNGQPVYKTDVCFPKDDIPEGRINYGKEVLEGPDWMKHIQKLCKEHGVESKPGKSGCPIKDGDKMKDKDGKPKEHFKGMWVMTFKSTYKPEMTDSKGKELPKSVPIMSGDIIKVAFGLKPVTVPEKVKNAEGEVETIETNYLALYLNGVRLLDKRAGAGGVDYGEEEGGYEAPEGGETDYGDDDDDAEPSKTGDF